MGGAGGTREGGNDRGCRPARVPQECAGGSRAIAGESARRAVTPDDLPEGRTPGAGVGGDGGGC